MLPDESSSGEESGGVAVEEITKRKVGRVWRWNRGRAAAAAIPFKD